MVGEDRRTAKRALLFRRLLLEDVAREGVPCAHLPLGGDFEALLGARVGLHLRHDREQTIMARWCLRRRSRRGARRTPPARGAPPQPARRSAPAPARPATRLGRPAARRASRPAPTPARQVSRPW